MKFTPSKFLLAAMFGMAVAAPESPLQFSSIGAPPAMAANLTALENRPPSFAAIAKRTMPVVVNIFTTSQRAARGGSSDPLDDFFGRLFGEANPRENSARSLGSGILISNDGEVLTSYHIVRNADIIKVRLSDLSEYEARLIGKDAKTDLALIKMRRSGGALPFARLGKFQPAGCRRLGDGHR